METKIKKLNGDVALEKKYIQNAVITELYAIDGLLEFKVKRGVKYDN